VTLYRIENLRKTYGDRTVLDIPELTIEARERCAILGPNGAGKTTLLHLLAFLDKPSEGRIRFRDQTVRFEEGRLQKLRRSVVLLDQNPILFSTTVYKNLEFGLKIRKQPPAQRRRAIDEALELVGMQDFAGAAAHRLSGGETQRIALARALVLEPAVLLCDEPTANVDQENQRAVVEILNRINAEKNITLIFSTHGRLQAITLAQRAVHLDHGRLTPRGRDNLFRARIARSENDGLVCILHPGVRLPLPADTRLQEADTIRLFLDPEAICIVANGEDHCREYDFQGRVIRVSPPAASDRRPGRRVHRSGRHTNIAVMQIEPLIKRSADRRKDSGSMKLYIGIDDTDNRTSQRGTGRLSRQLAQRLPPPVSLIGVVRQQHFIADAIDYTSHNSSACLRCAWPARGTLTWSGWPLSGWTPPGGSSPNVRRSMRPAPAISAGTAAPMTASSAPRRPSG